MEYGLSVIRPKNKRTPGMSAREYRSADKGQSWKLRMAVTIEDAMTAARSRGHFIYLMEMEGYKVRWSDDRKYITYTDPDGNKCRDIRLHEEKYLKENMEHEFRIRSEILRRNESQTAWADAAGREGASMRSRDRTQLGGADCFPESADRYPVRNSERSDGRDYQKRAEGLHESAAGNPAGKWQEDSRNNGSVSSANADSGSGADAANGAGIHRDADTGWEDQRAVFEAALYSHGSSETLYQEAVLDIHDSQLDLAAVGIDAAYLAANLSELTDENRPIEDCTTKHYRPERKKYHGHTMGGM